jgi:hypothetical protein
LHRLRSATSLSALTAVVPDDRDRKSPPLHTVETLGPIGPYSSLAIAAEGGRAVWIAAEPDVEGQLMRADLRGRSQLEVHRVDDDTLPDSTPRISADGRIVLTEVPVSLAELGSVSIARAFVLPDPSSPSSPSIPPPNPERPTGG